MDTKTAHNMERSGKIIAIVGVVLFGTSLIGHLHHKNRLNSISSQVGSIEFEIENLQNQFGFEIRSLQRKQESCENRPSLPNLNLSGNPSPIDDAAFFGCDPASLNTRAAKIADLETQLQNQVQEMQKPPGPFHSQGRRKMLEFQADSRFP
jgi:hypothetical protein